MLEPQHIEAVLVLKMFQWYIVNKPLSVVAGWWALDKPLIYHFTSRRLVDSHDSIEDVCCKPYVWPCRKSTEVQRGVADLIPYEEKWKLINHSTYLFRGVADLIPHEEKIPLVESVPVNLVDVSAGYQDCLKAAGYSPYLSPESSVFGGCRSCLVWFR